MMPDTGREARQANHAHRACETRDTSNGVVEFDGVALVLADDDCGDCQLALREHVDGPAFEPSVDGITLVQQYIQAPEPIITRVEFVGGAFMYAVRVDTTLGFELCPADVCQVGDAFCPVGEAAPAAATPRFRIIPGFQHPIVDLYRRFLADNGIGIAGIEFITDANGELYTYDVNTNTNYNSAAEAEAGLCGMRAIARYLGDELGKLKRRAAA